MNIFKWLKSLFKRNPIYELGMCRGDIARRNKITGEVQYHTNREVHGDGWINFDSTWWDGFISDKTISKKGQ